MINRSLKLTEDAFQIDSDTEDLDEQEMKMINQTTQQLCKSTMLNYLHRSQLVPFLKQKVLNSKISLQKDMEHVVKKYFTQKQNPLYKSNESLPQKIYVCGWCKQVLFYDFHYLTHCLNTKCPVNHPRSTYFFYHEDNMIKNQSIQAILEKKEFETLAKVEINKQNHFFSEYEIEKKHLKKKGQYYCGYCKLSYWKKNQQKFFNHCAYSLECRNHPMTTHIITLKQCLENTEEFVETILNFQLNYNLLTLFKNHYIRLGQNKNLKNSLACPSCMYVSPSYEYYLKHQIFQCTSKPNDKSQCPIRLRKIKTMIEILRNYRKSGPKPQIVRKSTLKRGQLKAVRIIDQQNEQQTEKSQKIAIVKQQNQDQSRLSSSKSSIIDQLQVIQCLQNIQDQDQFNIYDRILFPNIDYTYQFSRYYCQECNKSFKKDTLFMQHLVSCKSYENFKSSHFFTTCDRIQKIIEQISMKKNDWEQKEFLGNQYSDYSNQTHYRCGCGKVDLLKLFLDHVCRDHSLNVPSGSSHIILRVFMFKHAKKRAIYLPVGLKNQNPYHSFHCPCNPSKIYRYRQFIDHVIQKHAGRTPIFRMRKQN